MSQYLASKLKTIPSGSLSIVASDAYQEPGQASVRITFRDGTLLTAAYWRLITGGKARISSFDHQQKYGLSCPIDSITELRNGLQQSDVVDVKVERETGDLILRFAAGQILQVFNFSSYEIWDIMFPDGKIQYSNYVLSES